MSFGKRLGNRTYTVRLPPEVAREVKTECARTGRSFSSVVLGALAGDCTGYDSAKRIYREMCKQEYEAMFGKDEEWKP